MSRPRQLDGHPGLSMGLPRLLTEGLERATSCRWWILRRAPPSREAFDTLTPTRADEITRPRVVHTRPGGIKRAERSTTGTPSTYRLGPHADLLGLLGAQSGNRTHDLRITNALLYRLSYLGAHGAAGEVSGRPTGRDRSTYPSTRTARSARTALRCTSPPCGCAGRCRRGRASSTRSAGRRRATPRD